MKLCISHPDLAEHDERKNVILRSSSFFNHLRDRIMAARSCAAGISAFCRDSCTIFDLDQPGLPMNLDIHLS